jgi:CHAD domain-containing protein
MRAAEAAAALEKGPVPKVISVKSWRGGAVLYDDSYTVPPRSDQEIMETELKYAVEENLFSQLLRQRSIGAFEIGTPLAENLTDRYMDTIDRDILRGGYACRLRERAGRDTMRVTLKELGVGTSALHRREEYELEVPRGSDPGTWPESPVKTLLLRLRGDAALREIAVIRQHRFQRPVLQNGGEIAKLSLDLFEVEGAARPPVREVEIEAAPFGGLPELRAIGQSLESQGARPEPRSKLERALELLEIDPAGEDFPPEASREDPQGPLAEDRGLQLLHAALETEGPPAEPAAPAPHRKKERARLGVLSDEPMAEAGRKVLRFHLERMLAKEAGTREGRDIEALHDMRVAMRRQRAALHIVASAFRRKFIRKIGNELRTASRHLGAVRDLDVQIEAAIQYQSSLPSERARAFQPVIDAWAERRDAARAQLLQVLDSPEYAKLIETYSRFVQTPGEGVRQVSPEPGACTAHRVREVLPGRIWQQYGALRAFEPTLPCATVAALHALRIEAKRLRYILEFFGEVLDPCASEAVAALTALQDHLGKLHDADVTMELLRDLMTSQISRQTEPAAFAEAVGGYFNAQSALLLTLRNSFPRHWRRVSGRHFRQVLARSTVAM